MRHAVKVAADDDDVVGGCEAGPRVDDGQCRGLQATADVGRRRRRRSDDVSCGRRAPARAPDGATSRRRLSTTIGGRQTRSATGAPSSDRTLLAGVEPRRSQPLDVRLTDAICRQSSDAVADSVLRRSVSDVLCRQYARSRRRRRRWRRWVDVDGSTPCGALPVSVTSCLLAAALLVASVSADPRRYHGESSHSAAAHSRQLALPQSAGNRPADPRRRSQQSGDIGAGVPCIYEGHIKTDR